MRGNVGNRYTPGGTVQAKTLRNILAEIGLRTRKTKEGQRQTRVRTETFKHKDLNGQEWTEYGDAVASVFGPEARECVAANVDVLVKRGVQVNEYVQPNGQRSYTLRLVGANAKHRVIDPRSPLIVTEGTGDVALLHG